MTVFMLSVWFQICGSKEEREHRQDVLVIVMAPAEMSVVQCFHCCDQKVVFTLMECLSY